MLQLPPRSYAVSHRAHHLADNQNLSLLVRAQYDMFLSLIGCYLATGSRSPQQEKDSFYQKLLADFVTMKMGRQWLQPFLARSKQTGSNWQKAHQTRDHNRPEQPSALPRASLAEHPYPCLFGKIDRNWCHPMHIQKTPLHQVRRQPPSVHCKKPQMILEVHHHPMCLQPQASAQHS